MRPLRQSSAILVPENPLNSPGPQSSPLPWPQSNSHGVHFCLMFLGVCILLPEPECEPSLSDTWYASSQILSTLPVLSPFPLFHLCCHHSYQLCIDSTQLPPSHHAGPWNHFASVKEMHNGCMTVGFSGLTMFSIAPNQWLKSLAK